MPPKKRSLESALDGEYWSPANVIRRRNERLTTDERYEREENFVPVCTLCGNRARNWIMQPGGLRKRLAEKGLIFCVPCARKAENARAISAIKSAGDWDYAKYAIDPLTTIPQLRGTPVSLQSLATQALEPEVGEGLPEHLLHDADLGNRASLRPTLYYQSKKGHKTLEKLMALYKIG